MTELVQSDKSAVHGPRGLYSEVILCRAYYTIFKEKVQSFFTYVLSDIFFIAVRQSKRPRLISQDSDAAVFQLILNSFFKIEEKNFGLFHITTFICDHAFH